MYVWNDVKGVERSINSFNCYSCWKGRKWCLWLLLTQHCIQSNVPHLTHVERAHNIFTHNFLNIQLIFNPKKVLESWDLDLSNHTKCYVCQRDQKLFRLSTLLTCFDIHNIWWYGWKGVSLSFPKHFSDWKLVEY